MRLQPSKKRIQGDGRKVEKRNWRKGQEEAKAEILTRNPEVVPPWRRENALGETNAAGPFPAVNLSTWRV